MVNSVNIPIKHNMVDSITHLQEDNYYFKSSRDRISNNKIKKPQRSFLKSNLNIQ